MKIDIPKNMILKLLETSPVFREFFLDEVSGQNEKDQIRESLIKETLSLGRGNKIQAIKKARDLSQGKLEKIYSCFPGFVFDRNGTDYLSLTDAKHLVEFVFDNFEKNN
jgi:hypothetical protein